tara:strand:- start:568 stop:867 length:300 start_codon:yes stop_codon:yes gene_type:complete
VHINRRFSFSRSTLALLSVTLLLWMNFAFIQHQYDLIPSHHQEHHCELFSAAHHAIISATPNADDHSLPDRFESQQSYQYQAPSAFVYRARSPPLQLNV